MTAVASGLAPGELARSVPACPDWTVKELVAHVIGVGEDFASGNVERAGAPEWTKAQIRRRAELDLSSLLDEWAEVSQKVEPTLDEIPEGAAAMVIGDAVTHEHDLRGAVGRPGGRDSDAMGIALNRYVKRFGKRIKDAELPSVTVTCDGRTWRAGVLDPAAELTGEPFELLRALTGRRTIDEIAALGWTGDQEPYLGLVASYSVPAASLGES